MFKSGYSLGTMNSLFSTVARKWDNLIISCLLRTNETEAGCNQNTTIAVCLERFFIHRSPKKFIIIMWGRKIPARLGLTIFGVEIMSNSDIIDPTSPTAQKLAEEARKAIENETGWDRLKAIFQTDEFNSISPELDTTLAAAAGGFIAGMFLGGIPASKLAHDDFISRNKASKFDNHIDAKSKMQFSVTKAMAVGGWRVGWRLALFTGGFTFFTTAISTYRNKSSVFEYSAGGLIAGSIYKLPMGPKAMVSGGIVGAAMGTIAGALTVGTMKLSGTTTEELRYWRKGWKEAKTREVTVENPRRKEATGTLGLMHDMKLTMKADSNSIKESEEENEKANQCELNNQKALPSETS